MSSPNPQSKLDFRDNTTLRLIHEATLQDLLQARNYAALQLLEERNALLRERESLGATKIEYADYDFITPPKPDALLPYTTLVTLPLNPDSPRKIIPFRVSRPPWAHYPVDRSPIDASTQTEPDNDPDNTLTEIEPDLVTSNTEVQCEFRKKRKAND